MIWPPGKTSIRNRPPLISSTAFASRSAALWTPSPGVKAVDIRHWTFGWAMTLGASAATVAAIAAPTVARNRRRSVISRRHELMVRAFRDVIPRADERLELRVRRVHLPGHRRPLGFLLDDLGRQLLELTEHRCW